MKFKKGMSIEEYIAKAFTSGDLSTGGLLSDEQDARMIRGAVDSSVIFAQCRREPMSGPKKQLNKIAYATRILQKAPSVGTAPSSTSKPTTSKVTLDAKEILVAIDIGYDSIEDNIEGESLFDTILELTNQKLGPELDELIMYGDSAGSEGNVLDTLDGLLKQATSHVYDLELATLSSGKLFNTLKMLPGKYLQNQAAWRFWVSHNARLDYNKELSDKSVDAAFTSYLVQGSGNIYYNGIPVEKVGAIPTEELTSGSTTADGSHGVLVMPQNVVVGIHRGISYEFMRQPRERIIEVTMTMRLDVKLEEEDAIVEMKNIGHSA